VAYVGATVLTAPLDGVLRGLTHDGVPVTVGTKVIEVDPRGPAAVVRGMSERPGTIAEGVLRAVQAWVEQRARQTG
jgi:xanthine dehydrogenase accessory factor